MVYWGKSKDGHIESKCGEYTISPLYWGCCTAQGYELTVVNSVNSRGVKVRTTFNFDTQSEAKIKAGQYDYEKNETIRKMQSSRVKKP